MQNYPCTIHIKKRSKICARVGFTNAKNYRRYAMFAHRTEITINQEGILRLENLPFKQGDKVEIVILKQGLAVLQRMQRSVGEYLGKIRMADAWEIQIIQQLSKLALDVPLRQLRHEQNQNNPINFLSIELSHRAVCPAPYTRKA